MWSLRPHIARFLNECVYSAPCRSCNTNTHNTNSASQIMIDSSRNVLLDEDAACPSLCSMQCFSYTVVTFSVPITYHVSCHIDTGVDFFFLSVPMSHQPVCITHQICHLAYQMWRISTQREIYSNMCPLFDLKYKEKREIITGQKNPGSVQRFGIKCLVDGSVLGGILSTGLWVTISFKRLQPHRCAFLSVIALWIYQNHH